MKLVGDFLKRFDSLTPPHDSLKEAVAESVSHVTQKHISKNAVRIQQETAFISGSSIFKSVLQVKRGEILTYLYEKLPKSRERVRDIR